MSRLLSPIAGVAEEVAGIAARHLLPVTIRGEGAGRRMRGSADRDNWRLLALTTYPVLD
ncbi:hypothetical protein [Mesorhizobium sp.]|uniref:hypothetical protein n=1 Tax=Mesorhizobium sp. TaxID=1871066 RepID=UPI0025EAF7D4|nr:hypothetical protein [Mesorhizobium sp.]